MKKYLITGGAGFIGSSITKELLAQGHQVRVFDNLQRGQLSKLHAVKGKFEFVKGDIRDTKKVIRASEGCDGIIHLAYINGTKFFYSNPDLVLDIAIKGMLSVIEAGKINRTSELHLASSSEVYQNPKIIPTPEEIPLVVPDPYNPRYSYGGGKILCEMMTIHIASRYFKKVVIFRPHNVYGPNMGDEHVIPELTRKVLALKQGKKKKLRLQGSGKETRSYIYIDDFVKGFSIVLRKSKNLNTYNIGTENEITSKSLASKIAKILGVDVEVMPGKLRAGSTPRRCPDISRLRKLGFVEQYTLETGLAKTIDWYSNN